MLLCAGEVVSFCVPAELLILRYGSLDDLEVDPHEVGDVDPAPRVGTFVVIERAIPGGAEVLDEHGSEDAGCFSRPRTFTVDIRWTHDSYFQLLAMLCGSLEKDLFRVTMEGVIWEGGYAREIFEIGPDLGVEDSEVIG